MNQDDERNEMCKAVVELTQTRSASDDEWRWELLKKLPTLDPTWPPAVQDRWWAVFWKLLGRSLLPTVAGTCLPPPAAESR